MVPAPYKSRIGCISPSFHLAFFGAQPCSTWRLIRDFARWGPCWEVQKVTHRFYRLLGVHLWSQMFKALPQQAASPVFGSCMAGQPSMHSMRSHASRSGVQFLVHKNWPNLFPCECAPLLLQPSSQVHQRMLPSLLVVLHVPWACP